MIFWIADIEKDVKKYALMLMIQLQGFQKWHLENLVINVIFKFFEKYLAPFSFLICTPQWIKYLPCLKLLKFYCETMEQIDS